MADPFETAATDCQLIVLVKSGTTSIASLDSGRWRRASYMPGDLGLTPAGETARLRWEGRERHVTLQLHLPYVTLVEAAEELRVKVGMISDGLNSLSTRDAFVQHAMLALEEGADRGLPNLYAETAGHLLALHLVAHTKTGSRYGQREAVVLERIDEFMKANLANPVSLTAVAQVAGRSKFQVIRLTKSGWGETPFAHLVRLRMEHARKLLEHESCSSPDVALQCGYTNPAHFAVAFRRSAGMSPSRYRTFHKKT